MGALVRVNGGMEKGQCGVGWSGSIGALVNGKGQWALVRVNGGIEQWGLNGGIEKDQWGHWSGSMATLKRVNGGLWSGSMGAWSWLWVRQGLGFGSDRRLSYRVVSSTLQVASSTLQGCKLYLAGL